MRYHAFRWSGAWENADGIAGSYLGTYSSLEDAQRHFLDDFEDELRDCIGEILEDDGEKLALAAETRAIIPPYTQTELSWHYPIRDG